MPREHGWPFRRLTPLLAAVAAAAAVAGCGGTSSTSSSAATSSPAAGSSTSASSSSVPSGSTTTSGAGQPRLSYEAVLLEQGPSLGSASTTGTKTVDGIQCGPTEQLAYHIHAHLAVFGNGTLYSLPGGIGIPGSAVEQTAQGPVAAGGQCIYWLHTHTSDGIIHIESPTKRIYSLGTLFDEWRQPLSSNQVASVHGKVAAVVNGKRWAASPRAIPLLPHEDIQLNVGEPAPPLMTVDWGRTGL